MAWITPTIAAVGALASLAASTSSGAANNRQQQQQYALQQQQMQQDQQNQQYQRMVQAMVNQRAVAGSQDSFGTTVQYDPATNSWIQKLGPLPQQADTAAINANMTRNTTDLMQQELANRVSMNRAAQAGNAADTAQRNLANFRPMSAQNLTDALTQQGVIAARQTYDPLRADTLRSVARTGTAAGPVLRELGLGEAQNLRNTLLDAQIQGMTQSAGINSTNYNRLANAAGTTQALATPTLNQGNLGTSATDQLLQQLTSQRASFAPSSTAQGSYGANSSFGIGNQGVNAAAGSVPNSNFALQQAQSGLKDIGSFASNTGSNGMSALLSSIFGGGGPSQGAIDQFNAMGPSDAEQMLGLPSNGGWS